MNYLFKVVAILVLLLQTVICSHIRKDLVQIENDSIVQVDATTSLDSNSGRIAHLTNSPTGSLAGTRGVVYSLLPPANCKPVERSDSFIASSYIRVALVADDGECSIDTMLTQAQHDGAVGAIVYSASEGPIDPTNVLYSKISTTRPLIPVMLVDSNYGETLKLEVNTLENEPRTKSNNRERAIFVSMYPGEDSEHLSGWEVSLIALVVVLALCFCTSLFFHIFSNRRGIREYRRRHALHTEDMEHAVKRIQTLPTCALDRLMLRTVTEEDMEMLSECTTPLDTILNPSIVQRSTNSIKICADDTDSNTNANCKSEKLHKQCGEAVLDREHWNILTCLETDHGKCTPSSCNSPLSKTSILNGCISTCIVCIDDFVVGSKMRILPCGHNYHIECIDPWLTSKSSLCPLCKYDTRSVLTDLERALSGPLITADDGNVDDIFAGSSVYSDSSDPSSYLVESHARMPLSSIVAEFKRIASEKIAAPLGQMTSKMAAMCRKSEPGNQNRSNEKSPSSINAGSIYYGDQERGSNSYPFENSNAIFTTSTPAFPQMDLSGANKFGLDVIHCAVGSSSAMVKVNTSDPTPSPTSKPANTWRAASEKGSASSDSGQSDSADKNKKGDGAGNSVSLGLSRISIGELLHNDQDIMDCFD